MALRIEVDHESIAEFCARNGIRRLSFFGAVLRDDFTPESDFDVLVELLPDRTVDYFGVARMERDLRSIIGRHVDFRTPQELSNYFRDEVLAESEDEYVA
jgi:predicted nucleotidyltransferase